MGDSILNGPEPAETIQRDHPQLVRKPGPEWETHRFPRSEYDAELRHSGVGSPVSGVK